MKLDPTWLDAQYNNRALVPEFASYIARWQRDSAALRASRACTLDVPYTHDPALSQAGAALDIFHAAKPKAPVLFFIHGGYWRGLDKADHSFVAAAFPNACVVVPNYALCPGTAERPVTIPLIARQMAAAYAWTVQNIAKFGGNPARISAVGHSAGGHLVAMLLAANPSAMGLRDNQGLKRAVAISGLFELETIRHVPFLASDLRLTAQEARMSSPAWMPRPKAPARIACFVGADESQEFRRQNQLLRQAWGKRCAGVAQELPICNHFSALDALGRRQTNAHRLTNSWLEQQPQ